jgi:hypothetical protein
VGRERGEMGTTSVHASVSGWGEREKGGWEERGDVKGVYDVWAILIGSWDRG